MKVFKQILRCVAFLAGLMIILTALHPVLAPKNNTYEAGIEDESANGILSEKKNTIDVLVLGDSLSHTAISPMLLYKDYGITSYLCGSYGQFMYDTLRYLELAFENQSPKIVLLETDTLYRKFSVGDAIASGIQCEFPVFRYHDRWKDITFADFKGDIRYTSINNYKGYRGKDIVKGIPNEPYMIETTEVESVSIMNQIYMDEIAEFCEEKGVQLILVSTPSVINCNYARHNGIQEIADKYGLEYIDMNLMTEEVPIDWTMDTRDKGDHLNHEGARKVTNYLGKFLVGKNILSDHRNDVAYSNWNKSLDIYMEKIEMVFDEKIPVALNQNK